MDFDLSPRVTDLRDRVRAFIDEEVLPVELEALKALDDEVRPGAGVAYPAIIREIREKAKAEGLWNMFLPDDRFGPGLTNWEYGVLCEEMGRSPAVAPMAFNCAAPDTGNMEILAEHGTDEQQERWLQPLLDGETRSCFSMTEPEVSGSDPTTLQTRAELVDGEWVINGHKWFTSGAVGAALAIAMVVTDPDAHPYARASMIIVPTDNPGFNLVRPIPVMGHDGGPGHCEIRYEDCRVPEANLLGPRQAGFVIAQDRLGPGRIHHCMRAIGSAERANRDDVPPRERARGLRRQARRQAVHPGFRRQIAHGGRAGSPPHDEGRVEDGHRGQEGRSPRDLDDQGHRRERGDGRP